MFNFTWDAAKSMVAQINATRATVENVKHKTICSPFPFSNRSFVAFLFPIVTFYAE